MTELKPNRAKTATYVLMGIFLLVSILLIVVQYARGEEELYLRGFLFPLFLLVPVLFKVLKLNQPWRLNVVLYLFILFAFSYGCVWGAFRQGQVVDKVSHFISGFIFTIIGFCFFGVMAGPVREKLRMKDGLAATWALFFSMFISVCWEVLEMLDFVLLGNDSQNHLTTGVFDTMFDLISCLVASILSALAYLLWRRRGIKLLTGWVVEEFWAINCSAIPAGTAENKP